MRAAQAVVARWAINFAKVLDEKAMCWDWLGFSEENGIFQKGAERDFGEKRL